MANGAVVLPVRITGGAAGGMFSAPEEIFVKPEKVCEEDWATLTGSDSDPQRIAEAIISIYKALCE